MGSLAIWNFYKANCGEEITEYYGKEGSMIGARELVDIANVCMMLFLRYREEWAKRAGEKIFGGAKGR